MFETPQSQIKDAKEKEQKMPAIASIERLMEKSRFKRVNLKSPDTELEIGERRFKIETIEHRDSPDLSQVQDLFVDTFGEAEVDPEVYKIAGSYTPVPGGVGPVNVACLFKNLIEAASQETPLKLP